MRTTTVISDEPRCGDQVHDAMAEISARTVDMECEVQHISLLQDDIVREVEDAISILKPLERVVFRAYYIECVRTWGRVAQLLNYSQDHINRIHGQGLERLQKHAGKKVSIS